MPLSGEPAAISGETKARYLQATSAVGGTGLEPVTSCL